MTWNWRQRRMRLLAVAIAACGIALVRPASAHAGWPLASAGSVSLGFGATYHPAESTSTCTHHGVDIAGEPGARVLAPLAGQVTFVGRVPASGGGTAQAVSIATQKGSLTLLPLSSASVAKGAQLAEGDAVGTLAASGDGSSASTHVHVGLKRGDLYVDPLSVLAPPAVAPGAGVGAGAGDARASAHASGMHGATRTGSKAAAGGAAAGVVHAVSPAPLHAPVPGATLAPGVSIAGAPTIAAAAAGGIVAAGASALPWGLRPPTAAAHAPAAAPSTALGDLPGRVVALVASSARVLTFGALAVLAAIAALWPLWRRQDEEGSGERCVSTLGEDVAAVVGR